MTDQNFKYQNAACLSNGIRRLPNLQTLTGAKNHYSTRGLNAEWQLKKADLIVDWGNKRFALTSKLSARKGKPVLSLEDGFIRSIGLGVEGSRSFSVVSDWTGIYYDAHRPSDLENILAGTDSRCEQLAGLTNRALDCITRITECDISKYNNAPDYQLPESDGKRRILLIDQTFGDLSIASGMASEESFERMLSDALQVPNARILIKTHPDVLAGKKQGYFSRYLSGRMARELKERGEWARIQLLAEHCNPLNLIKQVDEVRVVSSQMGFEACMLGKPVHCYGLPFYAGWGLTQDHISCPRRSRKRSLEEVFSAAYFIYTQYTHPESNSPTELEEVLAHIERQKHYWKKNRGHFICLGFDHWKHTYVRNFLRSDDNHIEFARELKTKQIRPDTKLVVWGNNISTSAVQAAKAHKLPVLTMEDGFLRSVNLGKYGTEPRSLVLDTEGIYFNPQQPSDLEHILNDTEFSEDEREAAESLRLRMTGSKVSKYNVGDQSALHTEARSGQTVVLVPGQVGIDASIAFGCDQTCTNIDLLKTVRNNCPEAYIIFKPHPDIVSGNIKEAQANYQDYADQIETTANIHSCLAVADEVHTMTSLVGFEALMLKKPVHTYGRPFYAGWGLTTDHSTVEMPRRTAKLSLQELIAGTLIRYPRYINPNTSEFTTAASTLEAISAELKTRGTARLGTSLTRRWFLKARYGGLGILKSWLGSL